MIQRYEDGEDINWNSIEDKHLVGGVLMAFLLRLPEPLIPFHMYNSLIVASESKESVSLKMGAYKAVLRDLPEPNMSMLALLVDFLDTLTRDSDDNMMSASNLAICFAPALLRREEENLQQLMKESPLVNDCLTAIIDQFAFIFRVSIS